MAEIPKNTNSPGSPNGPASAAKKPADKSPDEFQAEIDSLKTDLHAIRDDISHMADTAYRKGRAKFEGYRQDANEQWDEKVEAVHKRFDEHPFGTLGVAAAIGFVIGLIFSARK